MNNHFVINIGRQVGSGGKAIGEIIAQRLGIQLYDKELLGMAARYIEILTPEQLRESIARVFASKGEKIVEANQQAFDLGLNAVK